MSTFEIGVDGGAHKVNGKVSARLILSTDGQQRTVERVVLDSARAVSITARRWANDFSIDETKVLNELRRIGRAVLAADQDAAARRHQQAQEAPRISTLADRFVCEVVKPEWHAGGKTIYSAGAGREMPKGEIPLLATDEWLDRVLETAEGIEANPDYLQRTRLFATAVGFAISRALRTMPERNDVAEDKALDAETLRDRIVAWMLERRVFHTDSGQANATTYWLWADGLADGDAWQQFPESWFFARRKDGKIEIAARSEFLFAALKYPSSRRLLADLSRSGLGAGTTIKVAGKARRVIELQPEKLGLLEPEGV